MNSSSRNSEDAGPSSHCFLSKPKHRKCASDTFAFVGGSREFDDWSFSVKDELPFGEPLQVLQEECQFQDDELRLPAEDVVGTTGEVQRDALESQGHPSGVKQETEKGCMDPGQEEAEKEADPKRARRILANRQSAQRSRLRKLQYTAELEKTVELLNEEISQLGPQVAALRNQRQNLTVKNHSLRERIGALIQETAYKDQMNAALRLEVERLKRQREGGATALPQPPPPQPPQPQPQILAGHANPLAHLPAAAPPHAAGSARLCHPRLQPGAMPTQPLASHLQGQQQHIAGRSGYLVMPQQPQQQQQDLAALNRAQGADPRCPQGADGWGGGWA